MSSQEGCRDAVASPQVPLPAEHLTALRSGKPVKLELVSKALNTSWNVQPENAESNFNVHGCCVNNW